MFFNGGSVWSLTRETPWENCQHMSRLRSSRKCPVLYRHGSQVTQERHSSIWSARTFSANAGMPFLRQDRKSTRLNSSHVKISYAVFCVKKKTREEETDEWRGSESRR